MNFRNFSFIGEIKLDLINYYDLMKNQIDIFAQRLLIKQNNSFRTQLQADEFKNTYLKIIDKINFICNSNMIDIDNYFLENKDDTFKNKYVACSRILNNFCIFIDRTNFNIADDSFVVFIEFDWYLEENESNFLRANFESYFSNKNFKYILNEQVLTLKYKIDKEWSIINRTELFRKIFLALNFSKQQIQDDLNSIRKLNLDFSYHERLGLVSVDKNVFSNLTNLRELAITNFHFNEYFVKKSSKQINILNYLDCLVNLEKLCLNSSDIDLENQNVFTCLNKLEHLNLENNYFEIINDSMFIGLDNLKYLNLSFNGITNIIGSPFSNLAKLDVLIMNGNPIRSLCSNNFLGMTNLTKLSLSDCSIDVIEEKTFFKLKNLKSLEGQIFSMSNTKQLKCYGIDRFQTEVKSFNFKQWDCICFE